MARWTGTWLQGPEVSLGELRRGPDGWIGKTLGLPREGTGSIASLSARSFAFFLDILASALVAGLVNVVVDDPSPAQRQGAAFAVLALESALLVALTGQTLGMRLMSLQVVKLDARDRVPGWVPAILRTLPLLLTLGLTGFFTREGRGAHDLLAGTAVVRS